MRPCGHWEIERLAFSSQWRGAMSLQALAVVLGIAAADAVLFAAFLAWRL
jgi:hypothetical protein